MDPPQRRAGQAATDISSSNTRKHKSKKGKKSRPVPITAEASSAATVADESSKRGSARTSPVTLQGDGDSSFASKQDGEGLHGHPERKIKPIPRVSKNDKMKNGKEREPAGEPTGNAEAGPSSGPHFPTGNEEEMTGVQETNGKRPVSKAERKKRKAEAMTLGQDVRIPSSTIPHDDAIAEDLPPPPKQARIRQVPQTKAEAEARDAGGPSHSKYFDDKTPTVLPGRTFSAAQAEEQMRVRRKVRRGGGVDAGASPQDTLGNIKSPPQDGSSSLLNPPESSAAIIAKANHSTAVAPAAKDSAESKGNPGLVQAQQKIYQLEQKLKEMNSQKEVYMQALREKVAAKEKQLDFKNSELVAQQKTIDDVKEAVTCNVCYELLSQPHSVNPCGHTACAPCFFAWFSSENSLVRPLRHGGGPFRPFDTHAQKTRKCMTCQTQIRAAPSVNYVVLELVDKIRDRLEMEASTQVSAGNTGAGGGSASLTLTAIAKGDKDLLSALQATKLVDETVQELQKPGKTWSDVWGVIFNDIFGPSTLRWYTDDDDHVRRCGGCGHELEGPYCEHCEVDFSDLEDDDDFMFGDEEDMEWDDADQDELEARVAGVRRAARRGEGVLLRRFLHRGNFPLADPDDHPDVLDDDDVGSLSGEDIPHIPGGSRQGMLPGEPVDIGSEADSDEYEGSFIDDADEEAGGLILESEDDEDIDDPPRLPMRRERARRAIESDEESGAMRIVGHGEPVARRNISAVGDPREFSPAYHGPEDAGFAVDLDDDDDQNHEDRERGPRAPRQDFVIDLDSDQEADDQGQHPLTIFTDEEDEAPRRRGSQRNIGSGSNGSHTRGGRANNRRIVDTSDHDEDSEEEARHAPRLSLLNRLRGRGNAAHLSPSSRAGRARFIEGSDSEGAEEELPSDDASDDASDQGDESYEEFS